jgi:hypothetical protein
MFNISVDPGGLLKNKDAEIVRLTPINFWEFNGNTDITLILEPEDVALLVKQLDIRLKEIKHKQEVSNGSV